MAPKQVWAPDFNGHTAKSGDPLNPQTNDRRSAHRFPLDVEIHYQIGPEPHQYQGQLVNISSKGLLMDAGRWIGPGIRTQLRVPWPARLNGAVSLMLNLEGFTVRTHGNLVAIRISRAEFRTRSTSHYGSRNALNQ